jgi:L-aminopeptidase/D-esterase-like protein
MPQPGPTNTITDVAGIRVGHATRVGEGWLTGTTVVLPPPVGTVAGVDVRGGGPGTRETDALDPRANVAVVHAITLTGGSAFGLAAADGVMQALFDAGVGYVVGVPPKTTIVPIVPAAVIFDLGRGGDVRHRPDASFGSAAVAAASDAAVLQGVVGAGAGAKSGGLKGGVGSASTVLDDGTTIGAIVVVNSVGSTVDPVTGELYAARFAFPGELAAMRLPDPAELAAARETALARGLEGGYLATTIGVVAVDRALTKAQCAKVAGIAHDGLARAIRPVHTMFDGDTMFTLSTGSSPAPDPFEFHALLDAAGDCVTRAVAHAMLAATTVPSPDGEIRSVRDALPSTFA